MIPEAAIEIQNQLAFISAVLAGFAVTFFIGLLQLPEERPHVKGAVCTALVAAALLLLATVAGVAGAVWIAERPGLGQAAETPDQLLAAFQWAGRAFIGGLLFLLISLGLSGWIHSRVVGILSSVVAALTVVLLVYFLVFRMGFD